MTSNLLSWSRKIMWCDTWPPSYFVIFYLNSGTINLWYTVSGITSDTWTLTIEIDVFWPLEEVSGLLKHSSWKWNISMRHYFCDACRNNYCRGIRINPWKEERKNPLRSSLVVPCSFSFVLILVPRTSDQLGTKPQTLWVMNIHHSTWSKPQYSSSPGKGLRQHAPHGSIWLNIHTWPWVFCGPWSILCICRSARRQAHPKSIFKSWTDEVVSSQLELIVSIGHSVKFIRPIKF